MLMTSQYMEKFARETLPWISNATGLYWNGSLPAFEVGSEETMPTLRGASGEYNMFNNTITFNIDQGGAPEWWHDTVLVHELVHFLQAGAGTLSVFDHSPAERQAYAIQWKYMLERGLGTAEERVAIASAISKLLATYKEKPAYDVEENLRCVRFVASGQYNFEVLLSNVPIAYLSWNMAEGFWELSFYHQPDNTRTVHFDTANDARRYLDTKYCAPIGVGEMLNVI